jgi:hypothetical protein
MLLRPSSTKPDEQLPPDDVWVWGELGRRGTQLTRYEVVSIYDDVTWDKAEPMAGASDDWAYEHLGVYSWTTEFWDPLLAATGEALPRKVWFHGPSPEHQLAVARWFDQHHPTGAPHRWRPFTHPQLGPVELGGWDQIVGWTNPPVTRLAEECAGQGDFAIHQALAAPCLAVRHQHVEPLGSDTWRVEVGIANTGWLPTTVSVHAARKKIVLPVVAELEGADVLGGPARLELGQLGGRAQLRINGTMPSDGTPERVLARWVVRARRDTDVLVTARHQRAGVARTSLTLA